MIAAVPKELFPSERRVAVTPAVLPLLAKAGIEFRVESGAGEAAGYPDAAYAERGAKIESSRDALFRDADVVLTVRCAGAAGESGRPDLARLRSGQAIIGFCDPLTEHASTDALAKTGATLLSMELMPRITRAQSMDALSSMATIAGYKAVLLAADHLPKMFPMLMTAAGTVSPAKVLIVGAGVAGLQAISIARRLGGVVEAYDVRPAVKEQIQSLGAKFVELDLKTESAEDKGGYARAQDEAFYRRQRELMGDVIAPCDVVITTAAVPGKKAPILVTAEMVRRMHPGSVIVDIAAERGGNCELTRPGETVVERGVTILGPLNLASSIPFHASQMYSKNMATFLEHLVKSGKDGRIDATSADEIVAGTVVCRDGQVVHPQVVEARGRVSA